MDSVVSARATGCIAISRDDDTVRPVTGARASIAEGLIVAPVPRARTPERTLILGWNRRGPAIVRELDAYVTPGSRVVIVADLDRRRRVALPRCAGAPQRDAGGPARRHHGSGADRRPGSADASTT